MTPTLSMFARRRGCFPRNASGSTRRALGCLAAIALLMALTGCGGGGGGGGGTTPPPAGGGGGNTTPTYYLSAPSGVDQGQGLPLTGVNANTGATVSIPSARLFSSTLPSEIATLSQWAVSGTTATAVGTRYRVWAGTDNNFYSTDLKVAAGSTAPTTTQLSTLSTVPTAGTSVCPGAPTVLNDFANPANSVLVFRDAGISCGTVGDQFFAVAPNAAATSAPAGPLANEPVAVARNSSGAVVQVLWLIHSSPAAVGVSGSIGATTLKNLGQLLYGTGLNTATGDFASLAVVPQANGSYVWVYRDQSQIMAVNTNGAKPPVVVFSSQDADVLHLPAVVDGTNVFLAFTDDQNPDTNVPPTPPQYTCRLVRIDTTGTLSSSSGVIALKEDTLGSGPTAANALPIGLSLVGIAGNYLVYFNNGVVNGTSGSVLLEAVLKTATDPNGTAIPITTTTLPTTSFNTTSPPIPVANGVYFNVVNTGGTTNPQQTYFYKFAGGTTAAVGGANGSLLLGGVLASPAPAATPASPSYDSVILAEPTSNASLSGATIVGYDNSGFNGAILGSLPSLKNDTYQSATLSEAPLQAGVPALVEVSGVQSQGNSIGATDLFEITPGTNSSLKQVTANLQ